MGSAPDGGVTEPHFRRAPDGRCHCSCVWKMQHITCAASGMESSRAPLCPYSLQCFQILESTGNGVSSPSLPFPLPVSLPSKFTAFPTKGKRPCYHTSVNSGNGLSDRLFVLKKLLLSCISTLFFQVKSLWLRWMRKNNTGIILPG